MKRIPPSVQMKEEVEQLLRGDTVERAAPETPMRGFVRSLARYMLQVSIEEEATAFLGRGHYRRGGRLRAGWRNGYEPKGVQSEAGLLELAVPQLRATEERFHPKLVERLGTRSVDLEGLVRGMYVRGLSTQDVEDLYGESFGESRLSKSTVSRITQKLNADFESWRQRDLSDLNVVYLFWMASITPLVREAMKRRGCSRRMPFWKMGSRCCFIWRLGRGSPMTRG